MTPEAPTATQTANPYREWTDAFNFTGHFDVTAEIPKTKADFLKTVRDQIKAISEIKGGLKSYLEAIHSNEYYTFDEEFLKHETEATHTTVGQLSRISKDLEDVVEEVKWTVRRDDAEVSEKVRQAVGHAQPWVNRTRVILINAHVFYKINYVLGGFKANDGGH